MEYTNEMLEEMQKRRKFNKQVALWLKKYVEEPKIPLSGSHIPTVIIDPETGEIVTSIKYNLKIYNRAERILHCLDNWNWDTYHKAKIMDLKRVNLCHDIHFCPNCKILETCKYIHKMSNIYKSMLSVGYHFYFLTLTVPSIHATDDDSLRLYVDKLCKNFSKLKVLYSSKKSNKNSFSKRSIDFDGGIRVLEITHNDKSGYHPHLHCIIASKNEIPAALLKPKYKAKYSRKRKKIDYKNEVECELAKIWTLIHYGCYRISNYDNYTYDPRYTHPIIKGRKREDIKNLEVNFRELDPNGFKETFSYVVKSSEITSYPIFKQMYIALIGRHVRQAFGCMYDKKLDISTAEFRKETLPPECIEETPESLFVHRMEELYTVWAGYKKISRFNSKTVSY